MNTLFIAMIAVIKKVYIITVIICLLTWSSLVNFSNFPADKYKLKQDRNIVELQRWKDSRFCLNESTLKSGVVSTLKSNVISTLKSDIVFSTLKSGVVSTLKSDVETTLKNGCFPDVEINHVVSMLKIGVQRRDLKSTLKQHWNNVVCRLGPATCWSTALCPSFRAISGMQVKGFSCFWQQ